MSDSNFIKGSLQWIDRRLPVINTFERHLSKHPVPAKVNFWYLFGALSAVVLIIQLISGIWVAMAYNPSAEGAFASIEYIMRDLEFGWLLRYMHSTGASAFFIVVYLHIFRGMLYGSYQRPRELVWLIGCVIFFCLMSEAFLGYVLPYGQMSYWGAQVIVSLFGAIPVIGDDLLNWIRGDYIISGITLNRFFVLHVVLLPLLLIVFTLLHIIALHEVGAGNPEGTDIDDYRDERGIPAQSIPFFPYKVLHAIYATGIFLILFAVVMFYLPEFFGFFLEAPNFEEANQLKTPEHIVPVWYFLPFYAMLRAATFPLFGMDAKLWGGIVMVGALLIVCMLPWLDRSRVKSMRYKGRWSKAFLGIFVVCFGFLAYLGAVSPTPMRELGAQICTAGYFLYFLLMPWYTSVEKQTLPPEPQLEQ